MIHLTADESVSHLKFKHNIKKWTISHAIVKKKNVFRQCKEQFLMKFEVPCEEYNKIKPASVIYKEVLLRNRIEMKIDLNHL